MNKERRKTLEKARCLIEEVKDDEQTAFDNLSEGLQTAENGQKMETAVNELDNAISSLEDAVSNIETASE